MNPSLKTNQTCCPTYIYRSISEVFLPIPHQYSSRDFLEVFNSRRSNKSIGVCDYERLSKLLYMVMRPAMIGTDNSGSAVYKRSFPSAGGRSPVDILICLPSQNLFRKIYYYDPQRHSINLLDLDKNIVNNFITDVNSTLELRNSTLVWFAINIARTSSKYLNPESLYWRDLGALIYCIQITCTYLDLCSCPIGYLAENTFVKLFNDSRIISGGGIIVGTDLPQVI